MAKQVVFEGIATALITPLDKNGVNYDLFGKVLEAQVNSNIEALVICGTTGEASTLTDEVIMFILHTNDARARPCPST